MVMEIGFVSKQKYIKRFIEALAKEERVDIFVSQSDNSISVIADENDASFELFIHRLASTLPASIFMKDFSCKIEEETRVSLANGSDELSPFSVSLCPRCLREIFDPSSRRYYYPFTSCNCCGYHYPLLERYPYIRENTGLSPLKMCDSCLFEFEKSAFRKSMPDISCTECGVPIEMGSKKSKLYADEKESYKRLFETAAKEIDSGRRVLVKSLNGWRLFFDPIRFQPRGSMKMLIVDATKIAHICSVIDDEKNLLLSIEKPLLNLTVADDSLAGLYGRSALVKHPDDGFTILLSKELLALGRSHIAYIECKEREESDWILDYDLKIEPQKDLKLFVNKGVRFVAEGERAVFPFSLNIGSERIVYAHEMAAIPIQNGIKIDRSEKFGSAAGKELFVVDDEMEIPSHSNRHFFSQAEASILSVLAENGALGTKSVGVYFEEEPIFLYYDGKRCICAVPSVKFESQNLEKRILELRDGSERLTMNFSKRFPNTAERLFGGYRIKSVFDAASIILDLKDIGIDALQKEALKFSARGGLQVDMTLNGSRFDPYAFLASLMSYRMADAEAPLVAFSIFESFGDYIVDVSSKLKQRAKAKKTALCGKVFATPSLYSRVESKMAKDSFYMNRFYPMDRKSALIGALYI